MRLMKLSSKTQTLRHIEAVRNYLNGAVKELLHRGERHDQSKLQSPEVEVFDKYTAKLKECDYGSEEYYDNLKAMKPALDHHFLWNMHHPEFHKNGIDDMNLFDMVEMLIDWKAASLRHTTGDVYHSIEINQERFGYTDEIKQLLKNTMEYMDTFFDVQHHAEES